jgi:3-hydroxyisobutyrate dehydrogenase
MAQVAFIGLGVMGHPMAGHLAQRGGHDVTVYNRTTSKAEKWVAEYGGKLAFTPKEAAENADIVFSCVGNDKDVEAVVLGDKGIFAGMREGSIFVDHTTASADIARHLYNVGQEKGLKVLDAPVSGGQSGAENGQLTIMAGGDMDAFEYAETVMRSYAKMVALIGPSGSGQLTKMVNQICIAGLVQALSEGIAFARNADLNIEKVISVISKGAAQSWQMDNRWQTMAEDKFDYGFAVDWMRKDLAICLEEAKRNGSRLPVTALVDQFYGDIQKNGGNRLDTSSLIKRLSS